MRNSLIFAGGALAAMMVFFAPSTAHAQYKNSQFTIGGGVLLLFPSNNTAFYSESAAVDPTTDNNKPSTTGLLKDGSRWPNGLPYRLANPMLEIHYLGKISDDSHWWFTAGVKFALFGQITDPSIPGANGSTLGYIEPMAGPRVYFLTDEIRPYFELALRCGFVIGANKAINTKLQILPGISGELGLEFIVARDLGLYFAARYTLLAIFDFHQENAAEGLAGLSFYF